MSKIPLTCKKCGNGFKAYPSQKRQYCSDECRTEASKTAVKVICQNCGDLFPVPLCRYDTAKYCSDLCKYLGLGPRNANIGSETIRRRKGGPEIFVKVGPGDWRRKAVLVLESILGRSVVGKTSSNSIVFRDGNSLNCDPENLILVEHSEPVGCQQCGRLRPVALSTLRLGYGKFCSPDCANKFKSLFFVGERNPSAKLTENRVQEILSLWDTGNYTKSELAKIFDLSWSTIHLVVRRMIWKHVV